MNIYDISIEYQDSLRVLNELEDLPDGCIEDTLSHLSSNINEMALNLASYIRNLDAEGEAISKAAKAMTERYKKITLKSERISDYLKSALERCEINQVNGVYHQIAIKQNPGAILIEDESLIPNEYVKEKTESIIDKQAIKNAIKNGIAVPGATLNKSTRLEIK